ncbi:MAG: DUF1998 domain-containing protein [Chlorobiaceae bacterium]|nr:DUF1998 domain-containing protein [Chlorobiaceae bacterium]
MENIRIGQLITPFGPGALYMDSKGTSLIIAGLDYWYQQENPDGKIHAEEFSIFEPRLSALLGVDRFRRPADYRPGHAGQAVQNAKIVTPVLRFPTWYREVHTGRLKRFNLDSVRIDCERNERWVPVRFISACKAGHLGDFPWKRWVGCNCHGNGDLFLHDAGGADLSSVWIECSSCNVRKSLAGVTWLDSEKDAGQQSAFQRMGIVCPGYRPWLGDVIIGEDCPEPLVGTLINQSNLFFSKVMSSISLPDLTIEDRGVALLIREIECFQDDLPFAKVYWRGNRRDRAVNTIQFVLNQAGIVYEAQAIEQALEQLFAEQKGVVDNIVQPELPEDHGLSFRRDEFNILRTVIDDEVRSHDLRVIASEVPDGLCHWFQKVHLVERLRETRAFYGFSRLVPDEHPLDDMPEKALKQLFLHPPQQNLEKWLPAITVYGEGIYIELSEAAIESWIQENREWLSHRLSEAFWGRLANVYQVYAPKTGTTLKWAARYLLVHSLSHILINQMVFEAGYSSASLKERLYVSADNRAPMAGMLIYTAAGDSEGTLGGLVRMGHKDRLEPVIRKAVSRASWCSADPVCSENLGGQGTRLANLAACHACIMLPETACETMNNGLDRAMVIGIPDEREHGFLSRLLDEI